MRKRNYALALFLLACLIVYAQVSIQTPICFGDCGGYKALMGTSPFAARYYEILTLIYRAKTVPVLYSFFGDYTPGSAMAIVVFQTLMLFSAWMAFALSVAALFRGNIRIAVFVAIALAMFGRGYFKFNYYLLSDSLSLALLLLWYALVLALPRIAAFPRTYAAALRLCVLLAVMVAGSRDASAFFLPFGIAHLFFFRQKRGDRITLITCFLIAASLPFFYGTQRHNTNTVNLMVGVIMPDPEKTEFFTGHGAWLDKKLSHDASVVRPWDFRTLDVAAFSKAADKTRDVLGDVVPNWRHAYIEYVLLHPGYVLSNLWRWHDIMFGQSFNDTVQTPSPGWLSPVDDIPLAGLVIAALIGLFYARRMPQAWQGALIALAGFSNSVIGFHGDFWELTEMERHCFIGSIMFRIGCVVVVAAAASCWQKRRSVDAKG